MAALGGIETGGTKWVCAVGTGPDDLRAEATIPTTTPEETIGRAVAFFRRAEPVAAVGIGSFGPVDLRRGRITTTPKPGWAGTDLLGPIGRELGVPVVFDTDVNAAALAEHHWGAARGLDTFAYVTVGTGIGGGGMAGGRLLHGLTHPEFGHVRIPHDPEDPFPGSCPFHGDCWEGLASGPAIAARWGRRAEDLDDPAAWRREARYLALGLAAVVAVLSPQRIVLGGGVLSRDGLLEGVRDQLDGVLAGYVEAPAVVAPELAPRSGVLGAIALASGGELAA